MKLYFEKDGLKGLISGYVESRYWYINKDYRQSDEYHDKDIIKSLNFWYVNLEQKILRRF